MKTLVDLKKALCPGAKLTLVGSDTTPNHRMLNLEREIAYCASNGIGLKWKESDGIRRTSFLDYPLRKECVFYENDPLKFTCNFEDGPTNLTYKIIPPSS